MQDENCGSNIVDGPRVMELISSLYSVEEDKESMTKAGPISEETRTLKEQTARGLINGDLGYKVRQNNVFCCPFCSEGKSRSTYVDVLVHAYDKTTKLGETMEEGVVHRVLVEYLMWSTDLKKYRSEVGLHH